MNETGFRIEVVDELPDQLPQVVLSVTFTTEQQRDLLLWWLATAAKDVLMQTPKMHEYGGRGEGSSDLMVMGDALGEFSDMHDAPDAVKQELSVWFYVLGKVSRLISDYKQKRRGKPDTWHDISVYSMMARRIQESGRWP